ncbi:MAG: hypothetical protein SGPRY_011075 [Prymnesium sp.]
MARYLSSGQRVGTLSFYPRKERGKQSNAHLHSTIVRSHRPGQCPPPPPHACNYSLPSRRPFWCSPVTDARARYMLAGGAGQRLVCTYFELRSLPLLPRKNPEWSSWLLQRKGPEEGAFLERAGATLSLRLSSRQANPLRRPHPASLLPPPLPPLHCSTSPKAPSCSPPL